MAGERELDETTQVETTGHEWDGIRELDTPMPRWWLYTFYGTIIWAAVYMILYPAWPLIHRATPGLFGYSTRATVATELAAAAAANAALDERLLAADLSTVTSDPELIAYATAGGGAIFRNNCSQCHGAGAGGRQGFYPNLVDDDWLWGGSIADIVQTVTHGIRSEGDPDTRTSQMPAFGEILEPGQIDALVQYVLSLSDSEHDMALAVDGGPLFEENCAACHGAEGKGGREFGAPNLTDAIWLYGGTPETIRQTITKARYGIMPAFGTRLSPAEIRKVAIYVNTLGGGE